jgi:Arc/MetJ-type ribon-helix-helix transcriptional regulator
VNDDKLLKARTDGARADSLLKNEAFVSATESVRNELIRLWQQSKTPDERERVWQSVNLLEKLMMALVVTHDSGKLAEVDLKNLIEGQERKKRFGII